MRSTNRSYVFIKLSLFLLINSIFIVGGYLIYKNKCSLLQKDIEQIFRKSISFDVSQRIKEAGIFYSLNHAPERYWKNMEFIGEKNSVSIAKVDSTENLSMEERSMVSIQTYLLSKNPIRVSSLDSIFRSELQKESFVGSTAVIYIENTTGKQFLYDPDLILNSSFIATTRIEQGTKKEIILQGFAQIPFFFIMHKAKYDLFVLFLFWIIVVVSVTFFMHSWKVKNGLIIDRPVDETLSETQTEGESLPAHICRITPDITLNIELSTLDYAGTETLLTYQSAQILKLFLDSPEYFITYDDLVKSQWGNLVDSSSRLTQAIKRLRESIADIPTLQIENIRGKGYALAIVEEETLVIDEGNL